MTDAPTIFTAHDIPDLLNALPTLFGFRPKDSLVAVATHGPRRRLGFRLRVDIPPEHHVDELAELTAEHLRRQGAEGAILVAVTEQQAVASALLTAVGSHLHDIELVVSVLADGTRYWVDVPGFPSEGIPYATSDHHLSIVKAVAAGQQILPDREALASRFKAVEGPRRQEILRLADSIVREIDGTDIDDLVQVAMDQVRPILQRGLSGERVSDADAVRLAVWVSKREVRDEVWSLISRDCANEMLSFLTHVSGTVVPPYEPAVLSLTAFAAWLSGDGAQALIAVERALEADPSYGMSRGVLALLEGGVSPAHWDEF